MESALNGPNGCKIRNIRCFEMGNVKTSDPCITERIGPVLVGMSLQLLTTVPWECYDEAISIKQSPPLFLTNSPTKRGFHQYSTTKTDVTLRLRTIISGMGSILAKKSKGWARKSGSLNQQQ